MFGKITNFLNKSKEEVNYKKEARQLLNRINPAKLSYEQKGFCAYVSKKIEENKLVSKKDIEQLLNYKNFALCEKGSFKTNDQKSKNEMKQLAKDCLFLLEKERENIKEQAKILYKKNPSLFTEEDIETLKETTSIDNEKFYELLMLCKNKNIETKLSLNELFFLYTQIKKLENNNVEKVIPLLELRNKNILFL